METFISFSEVAIRLSVAMLLGFLLGIERIYSHKTVGMRTYALVSMGSALFVVISEIVGTGLGNAGFDPLRMAGQIVVGVGFLGAGLIILKDNQIQNLTTSAGLWLCAGIGMAIGFGLYWEGVFAAFLTFIVLGVLSIVEKKLRLHFFPRKEQ